MSLCNPNAYRDVGYFQHPKKLLSAPSQLIPTLLSLLQAMLQFLIFIFLYLFISAVPGLSSNTWDLQLWELSMWVLVP